MNHLAYLALILTGQRERELEREVLLVRKRRGEDDLPPLSRDGRWAQAMHRWSERNTGTTDAPTTERETAASRIPGQATLGCASA